MKLKKYTTLFILIIFNLLFLISLSITNYSILVILIHVLSLLLLIFSYKKNLLFSFDIQNSIPLEAEIFIDNDMQSTVQSNTIEKNHILRINAGNSIPVDGIVTFGTGFVDETPIGGNSAPTVKSQGAKVYAGSILKNGSLLVKALEQFSDSFANEFVNDLSKEPPFFIPILIVILFSYAILYFISNSFFHAKYFYLGFLILNIYYLLWLKFIRHNIAHGTHIGSRFMKVIQSNAIIITKPTIFHQKLYISKYYGMAEDSLLRLLGPLARRIENEKSFAILSELRVRNIPLELFDAPPSNLYSGIINGDNIEWSEEIQLAPEEWKTFIQECHNDSESILFLVINSKISGAISFSQKPYQDSFGALSYFKKKNWEIILSHTPKQELTSHGNLLEIKHLANYSSELLEKFQESFSPLFIGNHEVKIPFILFNKAHSPYLSILNGRLEKVVSALKRIYLFRAKLITLCFLFICYFIAVFLFPQNIEALYIICLFIIGALTFWPI